MGIDPNVCWPVCQHVCVEISEKTASYERRCEAVLTVCVCVWGGGQAPFNGKPHVDTAVPMSVCNA